jgi:hypothetical protein
MLAALLIKLLQKTSQAIKQNYGVHTFYDAASNADTAAKDNQADMATNCLTTRH